MGQTVRYREILCRMGLIDDGFVADEAGLGLVLTGVEVLDLKTAALALVQVDVSYPHPSSPSVP